MGKSQVEKYEQILSSDPASTVFVELAKTLIAEGGYAKAVTVCESGVAHHPKSVAGRVLWGKALIHMGRPAEAMEQFDRAIAVHKDNPHAYNLISEVLVQKGLYRSALPLLRKASALQPNDARVRDWLEQTQRALSGGPAPVITDIAALEDLDAPETSAPALGASDPAATAPRSTAQAVAPTDPFASIPLGAELGADDSGVMPGLTSVFQALSQAPGVSSPPVLAPPGEDLVFDGRELQMEMPTQMNSVLPAIPDIPVAPEEPPVSAPPSWEEPPLSKSSGLLGDLPDPSGIFLGETGAPRTEVSSQATEAIAQEYERELRKQAAGKLAEKTFLQKHGWKLAVGGTLTFALAVAGFFYISTRAANHGQDLQDALASAKRAFCRTAQIPTARLWLRWNWP